MGLIVASMHASTQKRSLAAGKPSASPLLWLAGASLLCLSTAACHRAPAPDVVAKVNGHPILRSDLDLYYQSTLGQQPEQRSTTVEQSTIGKLNVLRQLIDNEILQEHAAKLNLVATDEEVDAKVSEAKAPFTQEEFNKQLTAKGLTLDKFRHQIRQSLTADKLMNKEINSKINITDSDISTYYSQNKAEFNLVEPEYHLAQIIVTTAPSQKPGNLQNNKASNADEAHRKILELHNLLESGEDFGSLAANLSEQPATASNGGDMGFVTESQLRQEPSVMAAVARLKPAQITDIIPFYTGDQSKQLAGYAIYKLLESYAAGQRALNDPRVQQSIRQTLREGRSQLLKDAYYEILHDQAKVENYYAEEIFRNGAH